MVNMNEDFGAYKDSIWKGLTARELGVMAVSAVSCGDICGEHRRGTESRVQAKEESHRKNRVAIQRRDADRTKVGKCVSHESRKAAIVFKIPVP